MSEIVIGFEKSKMSVQSVMLSPCKLKVINRFLPTRKMEDEKTKVVYKEKFNDIIEDMDK